MMQDVQGKIQDCHNNKRHSTRRRILLSLENCNIYTFQRDTQCSCTDQVFISTQVSAVHVSDRNGPSSGASFVDTVCAGYGTCGYVQLVQRLRKNAVPAGRISTYHSLHIQYLQKKLLRMDRYGLKHVELTPEY